MKNTKREIIKKIIGPEAIKRGYKYSCSGKMALTTPLAIYSKTVDNLTDFIDFRQFNGNPNKVSFSGGCREETFEYESDEEFGKKITEICDYLVREGFDDFEKVLADPLRVSMSDQEEFNERYEDLYRAFEKEYDVPENASTRDIFKIIDEVYPKSDDLEGTELREFLFKIAAEYGRALLKFHDGYKKWDEKQKTLLFGRENSSVIRGQVINVLRYMFVVKKNGNHTDLLVNYSKYLTYSEKTEL